MGQTNCTVHILIADTCLGNLGAFVNGSMFMGLMGGYTTLPASLTAPLTRSSTQKALDNAATLPPKATKK
jgi:hypothetical protein